MATAWHRAAPEEIMEVLEIVGVHTTSVSAPILAEELKSANDADG